MHQNMLITNLLQDTITGECYRLDHLIKMHLEKKMADKKTSAEEKEALTLVLARLDGMDVVSLGLIVLALLRLLETARNCNRT